MSKSLQNVNASVDASKAKSGFRKWLAFAGPAYLVSVGYMDPGNWATDIAAGSHYGYQLLWVLLMSNLIAILLQSLSSRLGVVRGLDLAQASKERYPKAINFILYIFAEIAITACDLAEVLGMAIGIKLLTGLPIIYGVLLTFSDTLILLFLMNKGMRKMEAFIVALISIIGLAFLIELFYASPSLISIGKGFVIPKLPDKDALYIAIGIIGATVMPHNLYLHSSLVQTRKINRGNRNIFQALKYNLIDSVLALNLALLVNAAILILAAAAFFEHGFFHVESIENAYKFLSPFLGSKLAPVLFAVALIAAGQSSTITGTLAGQIVMEGYLNIRIQPWVRRMITRLLAIIPAVITISILGEGSVAGLLIFSQVVLSLQLGFAVIPLIYSVSDKKKMGIFAIKPTIKILSWLCAAVIIALNLNWVFEGIKDMISTSSHPLMVEIFIIPAAILTTLLLIYIIIEPIITKNIEEKHFHAPHRESGQLLEELKNSKLNTFQHKRITVAVDFSRTDKKVLQYLCTLNAKDVEIMLVHVVETVGAIFWGNKITDYETNSDKEHLQQYVKFLKEKGFSAYSTLSFGSPKAEIPKTVESFNGDLLIMGSHGHRFFQDLFLGTVISKIRHRINCPLLIISDKNTID